MLEGDLLCIWRICWTSSSQAPSSDRGDWEGDVDRMLGSEPCAIPSEYNADQPSVHRAMSCTS